MGYLYFLTSCLLIITHFRTSHQIILPIILGSMLDIVISWMDKNIFYEIPSFHPLWRKVAILKTQSVGGLIWDVVVVLGSLLLCANYIAETYSSTYENQQYYRVAELTLTYLFVLDFLLSWFISTSTAEFFSKKLTWIDVLTIVPVFLSEGMSEVENGRGERESLHSYE